MGVGIVWRSGGVVERGGVPEAVDRYWTTGVINIGVVTSDVVEITRFFKNHDQNHYS